jgi:hypothetical protein
MNIDDILLTKSEDDEDDDLPLNGLAINEIRNSKRQKWKTAAKHVSFQGELLDSESAECGVSYSTNSYI